MDVKTVAVLGAGTMGHGIAHAAMAAGYATVLYDVSQAQVDKGKAAIDAVIQKGVELGKVGGRRGGGDAWPAAAVHQSSPTRCATPTS